MCARRPAERVRPVDDAAVLTNPGERERLYDLESRLEQALRDGVD